jgi:hypothetical protein
MESLPSVILLVFLGNPPLGRTFVLGPICSYVAVKDSGICRWKKTCQGQQFERPGQRSSDSGLEQATQSTQSSRLLAWLYCPYQPIRNVSKHLFETAVHGASPNVALLVTPALARVRILALISHDQVASSVAGLLSLARSSAHPNHAGQSIDPAAARSVLHVVGLMQIELCKDRCTWVVCDQTVISRCII